MDPRVLLVTAVLAAGLLAQQAPQQPTFRTRAELVRLDVTVLDRNGKPLPNLTAEDFTVSEDGVPQKIQAFQFVEFTGEYGPDEDLTMTIGARDGRNDQLARDDVRLFLVFWDEYHILPNHQDALLREELTGFVRTMVNPTDFVAIMDPWTPMSHLEFSRDRYRLANQIRALRGRQGVMIPRNGAEENHFRQGSVPFVREQVSLSALQSAIAHLGALREGRKTIVYLSQEFGLGRDTNTWAMNVMRDANAANVAIYSINPRGLEVGRSSFRSGLLATIAHGTGGESLVTNSLAVAFRRAVTQSSASYLLGYEPSPLRHDGQFHKIEVKVKGNGLQVRARNGYHAPDNAQIVATREAARKAALPAPIEAAFTSLVRVPRPDSEQQPDEVATVLVPETPSPALSVTAPALWVVRTPADLKLVHSDPPPAAYPGREFTRSERILMRIALEGQLAANASVSIGLIDRRGKRLTELPFTRTPAGWLLDLPLQSIARGEYLIGVDAHAEDQRSSAYVPIRIQ